MEEVARIVLALETPDVAEEVMHFLDRTGRARVVGTAVDAPQLAEAVRQLEPDAVVAAPVARSLARMLNGSALLAVDTTQSVGALRRAIRAGAAGFFLWPAEREELALAAARIAPSRRRRPGRGAGRRGVRGREGVRARRSWRRTSRRRSPSASGAACSSTSTSCSLTCPRRSVFPPMRSRTIADLVPLGDEVAPQHVDEIALASPGGVRGAARARADARSMLRRRDVPRAIEAARRCATSSCCMFLARSTRSRAPASRSPTGSWWCSVSMSSRSATRSEPWRSRVSTIGAPSS